MLERAEEGPDQGMVAAGLQPQPDPMRSSGVESVPHQLFHFETRGKISVLLCQPLAVSCFRLGVGGNVCNHLGKMAPIAEGNPPQRGLLGSCQYPTLTVSGRWGQSCHTGSIQSPNINHVNIKTTSCMQERDRFLQSPLHNSLHMHNAYTYQALFQVLYIYIYNCHNKRMISCIIIIIIIIIIIPFCRGGN